MTAVTAGTSKTFTAQVDGSAFVVIAPGGAVGSVIDQNGNTQAIDPNGTRRTFGPLRELQSITVSMQIGNASVELNGWSGGMPITAETKSSGQTVLDDASRAAVSGGVGYATGILPKTYSAVSRVCSGLGSAFIGLLGDSTTVSAGSTNTTPVTVANSLTGGASTRYAKALADYLTSIGIPASDNCFFGEALIQAYQSVNYSAYDTRFATSGGASYYANGVQQSAGGIMWQLNSAGKAISYTPTIGGANMVYDRVRVIYCKRTTGSFTVSNPGGGSTAQTITTTGSPSTVGVVDVVCTRGSGIFNLTWVSGDNWIIGAIPWDTQTPRVNILTLGNYGDKLTSPTGVALNAHEWRGGAAIAAMALDACVVDMTINSENNDGLGGVATFQSALNTVAGDVVGSGADLILATPHAIGTGNQGTVSDAYVAAIRSVAATRAAQVFDAYATITPYATYPALYYDTLHLSAGGYLGKARQLGRFLVRSSGWVA